MGTITSALGMCLPIKKVIDYIFTFCRKVLAALLIQVAYHANTLYLTFMHACLCVNYMLNKNTLGVKKSARPIRSKMQAGRCD